MSNKEVGEMSFWEHLTELFFRLRRIFYAFIIATVVVMLLPISFDLSNVDPSNPWYQTIATSIIRDLQNRFLPEGVFLIPISFFSPLETYIFISMIIGAGISFPVAMYELYKFFNPALFKHERKFAIKFIVSFVGLFIFGFALGYLYIVPLTFRTMLLFSSLLDLSPIYNFAEFFSMVGMMLLLSGLLFTFPIYLYLLIRAGIIKTEQLTNNRKYLYGTLLIIIAIVDPDPSLITEIVTIIPIMILVEITLLISKRVEKSMNLTKEN